MKPLRVAMLSQVYLPFVGGAELQLAAVMRRLPALGIEPVVITRRHDDSPAREMVDGTPVLRLSVGRHRVSASIMFTLRGVAALARLRPDVVHAHELRSPSTTAVAYRMLTGTPVVAKVLRGGTLGDLASLSRSASDRARLDRVLGRIDAFAVISAEIDAELEAAGIVASKRHFIPNGVDTARFAPADPAARTRARAMLGLGPGPLVLFAGRLEHEKRVDRLVGLWPQVRAAVADAGLAVLGTGRLAEQLAATATEGVHLAGVQRDMGLWYAAADGFVLPSEAEGLSNAMLEAMATGLPCVATAVGAAPDLLAQGRGKLVPVDDDAALVAALLAMLQGPAPPDLSLRRHVEVHYSVDETAHRLANLYHRLAGR